MAILTETRHAGEFIVSEGNGWISRESITILLGQVLVAGAVLGRIEVAGASAVADAGNTGDGAIGAITVGAGAQEGDYTLTITEAAANAGNFELIDPQGDVVGIGTVGAAFEGGGLAFTLADGATDFAVGDNLVITVASGSKKYVEYDPAATDGSEKAAAILFDAVDATAADQPGVAIARLAEVNGNEITWKTGMLAGDIAAGIEHLKANNIVVR